MIIYKMDRSRRWCFTINNPPSDPQLPPGAKYQVYGREFGAGGREHGTLHLQGYIIFESMKSLKQVKKVYPRAHWEIARGSTQANIEYCSKEGDVYEFGERPLTKEEQGDFERKRWDHIRDCAKRGKFEEIDSKTFIQHYRTLTFIRKDYMDKVPDLDDTCGVWVYGEAGVGKSRLVREVFSSRYEKNANKWFDGYQDEEVVVIDDFSPDHKVLGYHLKIWADRYAFLAEIKGGAVRIRPRGVVITSQYPIENIWDDRETLDALSRRFLQIHLE
jgi:hypothetical protein